MLVPRGETDKPKPQPVPQGPGAAVGAPPHTPAPATPLPANPPHKELLKLGINASIDQVNQTVQQVTDAHRRLFGTDPSPGLVFDVTRGVGNGMVKDVNHLFNVSLGPRQAAINQMATPQPNLPPSVPYKIQAQINNIPPKTMENLHRLGIDPAELLKLPPDQREVYVGNAMRATIQKKRDIVIAQTRAMSLGSEFTLPWRAVKQISTGIKDIPFGLIHLATAAGKDVHDVPLWPEYYIDRELGFNPKRPEAPTHLFGIGKGLVKGVAYDVEHPQQRIGYLAMDVFSLFTAGAGGAARVASAVGRTAELGDEASIAARAGTFARTVVKHPYHEPIPLGFGAYQAYVPSFDNVVLRKLQEHVIAGWNGKIARSRLPEAGLSTARNGKVYDFFLSPERWTKRAYDNNTALDITIDTFPAHELSRLNTWHARAQSIRDMAVKGDLKGAYNSMKKDDRFAIGKLMTLIFTEDPNPVQTWTSFHERQIDDAKQAIEHINGLDGDPRDVSAMVKKQTKIIRNHTAQLDAIKRSVEMMENPTPQMKLIIDKAYDVNAKQERIKNEVLGFDPQIMAEHNSKVAAIVRGEHVVEDETGRPIGIMEKGQEDDKILARKERNAELRLNKEKRKLNTLERNLAAPSRKTGQIADRPALRAKLDAQREAVSAATDELLVHRHHREILGSRTIPLNIYERGLATRELETVYHGSMVPFENFDPERTSMTQYGKGVYLSSNNRIANTYAQTGIEPRGVWDPHEERYVSVPHVRIHKIDKKTLFNTRRDDKEFIDETKSRIEKLLPDDVKKILNTRDEPAWELWKGWHDSQSLIEALHIAFNSANEDAVGHQGILDGVKTPHGDGADATNAIFKKLGYTGYETSSHERFIFHPKDIHPLSEEDHALHEDEAISDLRAGRGTGYITTRTPIRSSEQGPVGRAFSRIAKGKYGISKPRTTVYRMTGDALHMGDFVIDTSDLLAKELTHAVKAGLEMDKWQKIWDSAISTEDFNRYYPDENNYMMPVRDVRSVPNHLKQYVSAMERQKIDRKMIERMGEQDMDKLREWLYPKKEEILKEKDPHIRWMDERFFSETWDKQFWMKVDRIASNAMAPINEPLRFLLIFGTPAYMLNTIGSAGLLLTKQGFLAIPNLGRSFGAARIYGGESARFLDGLAGSTYPISLETEINALTAGSRKIAASWQRVTDLYFRRAAVIGRLREAGLLKDDMAPEDIVAHLSHEDNRVAVRQAAAQARNDMLDFDKQTWPEKAVLRHLVFVYAFMRAGSIYSVRWLLEHPIQADVLMHVGEDRKKEIERLVGKTPSWFLKENYFPIGNDTVLNAVQLNIPDTLNQLAYPFSGLANAPYESPLDLFGPAASIAQMALTGLEPGGKAVPQRTGFRPLDAGIDLFSQTPPGFFLRKKHPDTPLPPPATTSGTYDPISAAHSQESVAVKQPTFKNVDLWGGWGQVLLRSALPRHPNQAGMAARYWRDAEKNDPKAWAAHQLVLVNQMVGRQSQALNEPVPADVKNAVRIVAERELFISQQKQAWMKAHHGPLDTVGPRQLAAWTILFLSKHAYITPATARKYSSDLNQAQDSRQATIIWKGALRAAGTKPWETWVQRADEVDKFTQPGFSDVLVSLKEHKLGDYQDAANAPHNAKWAYGRQFVKYTDRLHQFTEQMGRTTRSTERAVIMADLKDYIERTDKPVEIGGHTFPSPVRMAYARLSPDAQANKVMASAMAGWSSLDSFSKELLGKPSNPDATYGYRNLTSWLDDYKKTHPGHNPPGWLKKGYVDDLEKKLPGFKADYEFAKQPLAYRLQQLNPIKKSPYVDNWNTLLKLAENRSRSLTKAHYTKTAISDQWTQYDLPTVQRWLNTLPVGFRRELAKWEQSHPHFLASLVK